MENESRRIILVTGTPRSGTTAVGKMLSLGRGVCNLHEPFNYHVGIKEIERYFEIIGTGTFTSEKMDQCIHAIRELRLDFKQGVFPNERGLRRVLKFLIGGRAINSYRLCRMNPFLRTIIWKDPLACFLSDYISKVHDIDVLVTIRNPWATAASFKRMQWEFDVHDIAGRLQVVGQDFTHKLSWLSADLNSCMINGTILWHMITSVLLDWSRDNSRIRFINLDNLVHNPLRVYEAIYHAVRLEWNTDVSRKIQILCGNRKGKAVPTGKKAHDSRRNIALVNEYWRKFLSREETEAIEQINIQIWEQIREQCTF
jgi:hypothetical protein